MPSSRNVRTSPSSRGRFYRNVNDPTEPKMRVDDLPEGEVLVQCTGRGWYLVQLGRGRYTKRFNVSEAEARKLRDYFNEQLRD